MPKAAMPLPKVERGRKAGIVVVGTPFTERAEGEKREKKKPLTARQA